jgi:hypothetical protein
MCIQPFEYSLDYSPAWRYSAQHMRWTDRLDQLGDKYVRKALGVADGTPTPLVGNIVLNTTYLISKRPVELNSLLLSISATMISQSGVKRSLSKIALLPCRRMHVVYVKYKRSFGRRKVSM